MISPTDRLINGLLKGFGAEQTPEHLGRLLAVDVEIVVPASRATFDDLWPAIWALASILERQLTGRIFIRCGIPALLACPVPTGPRCIFDDVDHPVTLSFQLGASVQANAKEAITGDARLGTISVGSYLSAGSKPTAIECFALAGFLGFAAIGKLVGIPPYRDDYVRTQLVIDYDQGLLQRRLAELPGITCVGLGQLGQAYLALLYFLFRGDYQRRRVVLVDYDSFDDDKNGRTQLLLSGTDWHNAQKVGYLAPIIERWNASVAPVPERISWGWSRAAEYPPIAFIGLHDLEGRRVACAAGFDLLVEAGVGTNLLQPRVTWHLLAGHPAAGRRVFPDESAPPRKSIESDWADALRKTPGSCGWVDFMGVSATAPCLGAAAVAFSVAELGSAEAGRAGAALLWSQLLPLHRTIIEQK